MSNEDELPADELIAGIPAKALQLDAPFASLVQPNFPRNQSPAQLLAITVQYFQALDNTVENYSKAKPLLLAWGALNRLKAGVSPHGLRVAFETLYRWDSLRRYMFVVSQLLQDGPQLLQDYIRCLPVAPSVFIGLSIDVLRSARLAPAVQHALHHLRSTHKQVKRKQFLVELGVGERGSGSDSVSSVVASPPLSLSAARPQRERTAPKVYSPPPPTHRAPPANRRKVRRTRSLHASEAEEETEELTEEEEAGEPSSEEAVLGSAVMTSEVRMEIMEREITDLEWRYRRLHTESEIFLHDPKDMDNSQLRLALNELEKYKVRLMEEQKRRTAEVNGGQR